jgi:hypothetical protein
LPNGNRLRSQKLSRLAKNPSFNLFFVPGLSGVGGNMPDILEIIKARDPQEREFHQAVSEVMDIRHAGFGSKPDLSPGQDSGKTGGAGTGNYVPGSLDG